MIRPIRFAQGGVADAAVKNSDPVTHNIGIHARLNPQSNHMTALGSRIGLILARPEIVMERCDIYPWMRGYIVVAKNPY